MKNSITEKPVAKKRVNFEDNKETPIEETARPEHKDLGLNPPLDDEKSLSVNSLSSLTENIGFIDEGRDITDRTSMAAEVTNDITDAINTKEKDTEDSNYSAVSNTTPVAKDAVFADVHIQNIIKKFDEQISQETSKPMSVKPKVYPRSVAKQSLEVPQRPDTHKKPAVPARSSNTKLRGRLDKSHSTPAYDLTPEENLPVEKLFVESKCVGMYGFVFKVFCGRR